MLNYVKWLQYFYEWNLMGDWEPFMWRISSPTFLIPFFGRKDFPPLNILFYKRVQGFESSHMSSWILREKEHKTKLSGCALTWGILVYFYSSLHTQSIPQTAASCWRYLVWYRFCPVQCCQEGHSMFKISMLSKFLHALDVNFFFPLFTW